MAVAEQSVAGLTQRGVDEASPIGVELGGEMPPAVVVEPLGDRLARGVGGVRFGCRGGDTHRHMKLRHRRHDRQLGDLGVDMSGADTATAA